MDKTSSDYFNNEIIREFVYLRTYSRWIENLNRRENWIETVDRYIDFMKENIKEKLTLEEYNEIREAVLRQEVMPSMRLLQFAGVAARRCNVCVYNCAYLAPKNFKDLADIMYISMSGCGVGFSVENRNVDKFPIIKNQNIIQYKIPYVIEDSKEGWCDSFEYALNTWFKGEDVMFDYSLIRPAGKRLVTMGGKSAGPKPLNDLMEFTRKIILENQGKKLKPIHLHDIICKVGQIIVSGSSRRSALISLSDLNDTDMRQAKSGSFWEENFQRCMANNSAVYNIKPTMIEFLKEWISLAESGSGERGIFNRSSLKNILPERRLKLLSDVSELGTNPCSEILLKSRQFCNLTEIVCRHDDTTETLKYKLKIATILGTYQSTLCNFKYISSKWKENQIEERLLGVSITGQWDCVEIRKPQVLQKLKEYAIEVNKEYSKKLEINESTAITTVKPSGTVSQLTNASSGIHPRFSPYYIRRIRISTHDALLYLMKEQGYNILPEVGQTIENATTFVLEFPVKSPDNAICVKNVNAIEQLEYVKLVKTYYTEHSTSVTIYVKPDEWIKVGQWIWENWDYVSGLSFLPYSDHIYKLAPYEEITKEKYEEMKNNLPTVDFSLLARYETYDTTDVKIQPACSGGLCEL